MSKLTRLSVSFVLLLAIAGFIGLEATPSDASVCALTNGSLPSGDTIIFNNLNGSGHSACYQVYTVSLGGGNYFFKARVQDTVDPSLSFDLGKASLQWQTPCSGCTNPFNNINASDVNSVDSQYNGLQGGVDWTSPPLNTITNGSPASFRFRLVVTNVNPGGTFSYTGPPTIHL